MADARLLNKPIPFVFEGKTYYVSPEPTFEVEATYQTFLERSAYLAIWRHRTTMAPDDYKEQLKGLRQDMAAHEYDWGGDVAFRSLRTEAGWKEMAWLLLKHAEAKGAEQPEPVTRELVERIARDRAKAQEMIGIVWGVKDEPQEEGEVPNPEGPGASSPPPAGA